MIITPTLKNTVHAMLTSRGRWAASPTEYPAFRKLVFTSYPKNNTKTKHGQTNYNHDSPHKVTDGRAPGLVYDIILQKVRGAHCKNPIRQ